MLPPEDSPTFISQAVSASNNVFEEAPGAGVQSEAPFEPVASDDADMEVAEILVFRPYFKYWHNCVVRRRNQENHQYCGHWKSVQPQNAISQYQPMN
jgi:hypothetical protein